MVSPAPIIAIAANWIGSTQFSVAGPSKKSADSGRLNAPAASKTTAPTMRWASGGTSGFRFVRSWHHLAAQVVCTMAWLAP